MYSGPTLNIGAVPVRFRGIKSGGAQRAAVLCRTRRMESAESQPLQIVESNWSPTSLRMALESKWSPNSAPVSL